MFLVLSSPCGSALAVARDAGLVGIAAVSTVAAVLHIRRQVDATAVASAVRGARLARALTRNTITERSTGVSAAATAVGIRRQVDTADVALAVDRARGARAG